MDTLGRGSLDSFCPPVPCLKQRRLPPSGEGPRGSGAPRLPTGAHAPLCQRRRRPAAAKEKLRQRAGRPGLVPNSPLHLQRARGPPLSLSVFTTPVSIWTTLPALPSTPPAPASWEGGDPTSHMQTQGSKRADPGVWPSPGLDILRGPPGKSGRSIHTCAVNEPKRQEKHTAAHRLPRGRGPLRAAGGIGVQCGGSREECEPSPEAGRPARALARASEGAHLKRPLCAGEHTHQGP